MTSSTGTNRCPSASATKRGNTLGTFTRANRRSSVSGSRTITARLSARFEMYGKRVGRVDGERCEHREDPVLVHLPEVLAVLLLDVGPVEDLDPLAAEQRQQDVEQHVLLAGHQFAHAPAGLHQLLGGRAAVGRRCREARRHLVLQRSDADLEGTRRGSTRRWRRTSRARGGGSRVRTRVAGRVRRSRANSAHG